MLNNRLQHSIGNYNIFKRGRKKIFKLQHFISNSDLEVRNPGLKFWLLWFMYMNTGHIGSKLMLNKEDFLLLSLSLVL